MKYWCVFSYVYYCPRPLERTVATAAQAEELLTASEKCNERNNTNRGAEDGAAHTSLAGDMAHVT